jgi:acetyl esterase/lipase
MMYTILLMILAAGGASPSLPDGARLERDVQYGPDPAQRMDVYIPHSAHQAPIMLMVHGGGWRLGDKAMSRVTTHKVEHWLPRGYIFVSIDNRLLPAADPLQQASDVAKSLALIQSKAASWGGDPTRVVLMGHSAGAHLVDLLAADPSIALREGSKPWLGTVSLDTASLDVVQTMQSRHLPLYDAAFGTDHSFWEKASPFHRLTGTPAPMLLVCSSIRPDHPCGMADTFAARARSLKGKVTVLPVPLKHSAVNEDLGLPGPYTDAVDSFLRSLGLP